MDTEFRGMCALCVGVWVEESERYLILYYFIIFFILENLHSTQITVMNILVVGV